MPPPLQVFHRLFIKRGFHFHGLAARPLPARRIQCFLGIQGEIDQVIDYLDMPLRLHEGAHDAKGPHCLPVFQQKARYDGMIRFFPRGQAVVMSRIQAEILSPVVQQDACPRDRQHGTEVGEMALDQGYHVPLTVCRAKVHRASAVQVHRPGKSGLGTDLRSPLSAVFLAEKISDIRFHIPGIGNIRLSVGEACLHGFQLLMHRFRVFLFRQRQMPQYVQRHEDDQAVAVGRDLADIISAVIQPDGLDPFRSVILQVRFGEIAARFPGKPDHFPGDVPMIKAVAAAFCQPAQRAAHLGYRHNASRLQLFAVEKRFQNVPVHHFIFQPGSP